MQFNFKCGKFSKGPVLRAVQIFLLILIIIGIGLLLTQKSWVPKLVAYILTEEVIETVPDNTAGLSLGEIGHFGNFSILPVKVEEDSRCPSDVMCIQAGTVRLLIEIASLTGTSTAMVELGEEFATAEANITLLNVTPENEASKPFNENEYRFNFEVVPVVVAPAPISKNACRAGGCSGQLCTDRIDIVTTCEYREEYICYQSAECERQTNGECGWTQTPELQQCLATKSNSVQ